MRLWFHPGIVALKTRLFYIKYIFKKIKEIILLSFVAVSFNHTCSLLHLFSVLKLADQPALAYGRINLKFRPYLDEDPVFCQVYIIFYNHCPPNKDLWHPWELFKEVLTCCIYYLWTWISLFLTAFPLIWGGCGCQTATDLTYQIYTINLETA